jgi:hypothetical protein
MRANGAQSEPKAGAAGPFYETLTSEELAARWKVPETWIRHATRSGCADPLPCVRLGRYVRFAWNSPELLAWWRRRQSGGSK